MYHITKTLGLKKLDNYKKSNEQLLKKAEQISSLLLELKNDREGEKLIDEYNSQIENILTLETKEQIEAFKIDTEMHLSLKAYVEKHEGKISSYQAKIEEVEKQKKIEIQNNGEWSSCNFSNNSLSIGTCRHKIINILFPMVNIESCQCLDKARSSKSDLGNGLQVSTTLL